MYGNPRDKLAHAMMTRGGDQGFGPQSGQRQMPTAEPMQEPERFPREDRGNEQAGVGMNYFGGLLPLLLQLDPRTAALTKDMPQMTGGGMTGGLGALGMASQTQGRR